MLWDKVGMQSKHGLEVADRMLRNVCSYRHEAAARLPFGRKEGGAGGSTALLAGTGLTPCCTGGRLRGQLLPVVVKGSRQAVVADCIRSSVLWDHLQIMHLTQNMRVAALAGQDRVAQASWADFLLQVALLEVPAWTERAHSWQSLPPFCAGGQRLPADRG